MAKLSDATQQQLLNVGLDLVRVAVERYHGRKLDQLNDEQVTEALRKIEDGRVLKSTDDILEGKVKADEAHED